jgi:peptidoglycan L-alanyl-D-glutamate endopeptidase CwlK
MYYLSDRSNKLLDTCHPDLKALAHKAITNSPFDWLVSFGHRTPDAQNKLFQQGRTRPGNIITYCDGYEKLSKHNFFPSLAFDIIVLINNTPNWKPMYYFTVAEHILNTAEDMFEKNEITNRVTWGGNWVRFKDYPHFQI